MVKSKNETKKKTNSLRKGETKKRLFKKKRIQRLLKGGGNDFEDGDMIEVTIIGGKMLLMGGKFYNFKRYRDINDNESYIESKNETEIENERTHLIFKSEEQDFNIFSEIYGDEYFFKVRKDPIQNFPDKMTIRILRKEENKAIFTLVGDDDNKDYYYEYTIEPQDGLEAGEKYNFEKTGELQEGGQTFITGTIKTEDGYDFHIEFKVLVPSGNYDSPHTEVSRNDNTRGSPVTSSNPVVSDKVSYIGILKNTYLTNKFRKNLFEISFKGKRIFVESTQDTPFDEGEIETKNDEMRGEINDEQARVQYSIDDEELEIRIDTKIYTGYYKDELIQKYIQEEYKPTRDEYEIIPGASLEAISLGEGAFGNIYKIVSSGEVIKIPKEVRYSDYRKKFLNLKIEHNFQFLLNHNNISKSLGIYKIEPPKKGSFDFGFKMGKCLGSLDKLMSGITDEKLIKYVKDTGKGLMYLHSLNLIHLDIAARNILLCGESIEDATAKITDFGLTRCESIEKKKKNSDSVLMASIYRFIISSLDVTINKSFDILALVFMIIECQTLKINGNFPTVNFQNFELMRKINTFMVGDTEPDDDIIEMFINSFSGSINLSQLSDRVKNFIKELVKASRSYLKDEKQRGDLNELFGYEEASSKSADPKLEEKEENCKLIDLRDIANTVDLSLTEPINIEFKSKKLTIIKGYPLGNVLKSKHQSFVLELLTFVLELSEEINKFISSEEKLTTTVFINRDGEFVQRKPDNQPYIEIENGFPLKEFRNQQGENYKISIGKIEWVFKILEHFEHPTADERDAKLKRLETNPTYQSISETFFVLAGDGPEPLKEKDMKGIKINNLRKEGEQLVKVNVDEDPYPIPFPIIDTQNETSCGCHAINNLLGERKIRGISQHLEESDKNSDEVTKCNGQNGLEVSDVYKRLNEHLTTDNSLRVINAYFGGISGLEDVKCFKMEYFIEIMSSKIDNIIGFIELDTTEKKHYFVWKRHTGKWYKIDSQIAREYNSLKYTEITPSRELSELSKHYGVVTQEEPELDKKRESDKHQFILLLNQDVRIDNEETFVFSLEVPNNEKNVDAFAAKAQGDEEANRMFCEFQRNPDTDGFWDNIKDVKDKKYILYQNKGKYWLEAFDGKGNQSSFYFTFESDKFHLKKKNGDKIESILSEDTFPKLIDKIDEKYGTKAKCKDVEGTYDQPGAYGRSGGPDGSGAGTNPNLGGTEDGSGDQGARPTTSTSSGPNPNLGGTEDGSGDQGASSSTASIDGTVAPDASSAADSESQQSKEKPGVAGADSTQQGQCPEYKPFFTDDNVAKGNKFTGKLGTPSFYGGGWRNIQLGEVKRGNTHYTDIVLTYQETRTKPELYILWKSWIVVEILEPPLGGRTQQAYFMSEEIRSKEFKFQIRYVASEPEKSVSSGAGKSAAGTSGEDSSLGLNKFFIEKLNQKNEELKELKRAGEKFKVKFDSEGITLKEASDEANLNASTMPVFVHDDVSSLNNDIDAGIISFKDGMVKSKRCLCVYKQKENKYVINIDDGEKMGDIQVIKSSILPTRTYCLNKTESGHFMCKKCIQEIKKNNLIPHNLNGVNIAVQAINNSLKITACNLGMITLMRKGITGIGDYLYNINDLKRNDLDESKQKKLRRTLSYFVPEVGGTTSINQDCKVKTITGKYGKSRAFISSKENKTTAVGGGTRKVLRRNKRKSSRLSKRKSNRSR